MTIALEEGDWKLGRNGLPVVITGREALLQQIQLSLYCKRGSFAYDTTLGSQFWKEKPPLQPEKLQQILEEALAQFDGVTVMRATETASGIQVQVQTQYGSDAILLPYATEEEHGTTEL